MGAQIILCDPHRAVVVGHDRKIRLRSARMSSPDIRAGIALLIAALSAEGTSQISNIAQIDRGYENIEERLNEIKTLLDGRKRLLDLKKQELYDSKDLVDKIYRMKYIEHMKWYEISEKLGYSKSQIYRITEKIDEEIDKI
jgi:hypothetical protein